MNKENKNKNTNSSSLLGLLIILFGILLLIDNLIPGIYLINWLFSWPVLLIACGLIIGHKSGYQDSTSYTLIVIGVFFFILRIFNISLSVLFWPIILIALGFALIWKETRKRRFQSPTMPVQNPVWDKRVYNENDTKNPLNHDTEAPENINHKLQAKKDSDGGDHSKTNQGYTQNHTRDEYIDSTSVFSSNKINIISKNFKGGNLINIFAGTEINLIHADMNEPVVLEVVQLFGGTKIIVPDHWTIQPEMAAFFGGIEDKRSINTISESNKILYIRGTSIFGGITIKSVSSPAS